MNPRLSLLVVGLLATTGCARTSEEPFFTPPPPPVMPESAQPAAAPAPAAPQPTAAQPAPAPPPPTRPAQPAQPQEAIRASHILVMHRESARVPPGITRTRDEARTRAQEVVRRARGGEEFSALARQFTDEPGGAERGGDLGRFARGAMVPPFEQAAFALRPGQISDVVETPFGYHVIRRVE